MNSPQAPSLSIEAPGATELFELSRRRIYRQTDYLFAGLMIFQWFGGIVAASILSPRTWDGTNSHLHPHVLAAIVFGALTNLAPAALALWRPGETLTRHVVAVGQVLTSALLIHVTGGRIETHFHVFGSLAFLSFYRDWRVLIPATIVVALDHMLRGLLLPESVYGIASASPWRWVEHAGWVIFEDIFLVTACLRNAREMWTIAQSTAETARRNAELAATRDTALDCIITTDQAGKITQFNPAAEQTFGCTRAQVIGWPMAEVIIAPKQREEFSRRLLGKEGPVFGRRLQTFGVRGDASTFPAEIALSRVELQGAAIIVAYLRDVTERVLAEEAARHAEKLALVASRTDNAVIITDPQSRIEWVNEGFTRITGYTLAEVRGRKPGGFLQGPETDAAVVELMRGHIAAGEGFSVELVNYSKAGRKYWLAIQAQPLRDASGRLMHFMAIESDITGRKLAEAQMQKAKEAAEAASRAKSDFLANISHEIRTPLNGVIGMTEVLIRKGLDDEQLRCAQIIKTSAHTLLDLINEVLDFSKIEAGRMDLESIDFDLKEVVEQAIEMLAPRATAKGLELASHIPATLHAAVHGDPTRFRQILVNLISNAIKFTERGEVIVRVTPEPQTDAQLVIRVAVQDTGIGIPSDRIDRLFQSFSQVDASTTRKYGGTGLGLAICKQLAELMGGTIGVESSDGRGSTFWFTVRLSVSQKPQVAGLPRLDGLRVLAVDDHASFRQIVSEQLSTWGFAVTTAEDGPQALQMLDAAANAGKPIQVALIDYVMPGMSGLDLARAIRQRSNLVGTALLSLSSLENTFNASEMREAGFAACLTKPVRQSQLFDAIAQALSGKTAPRPAGASTHPAAASQANVREARVLLVEDNEINQMVALEFLTSAGFVCDVANDGRKAIEAVRSGRFQLVLMDCQMPEMDGFEATRRIRALEAAGELPGQHRPLPIIALTANAVEGDRDRCLEAGMNAYVTKPIDPEKLIETIESLLANGSGGTPAISRENPVDADKDVVPIDAASLLARCNGKVFLMKKLLATFQQQAPMHVESIEAQLTAGQNQTVGRLAHTIKGMAANLSAEPLRAAAGDLERQINEGELDAAMQSLTMLKRRVEECVNFVQAATEAAGAMVAPKA